MTLAAASCIKECLTEDYSRTISRIVAVSKGGVAPENDPAIFALAMASGYWSSESAGGRCFACPRSAPVGFDGDANSLPHGHEPRFRGAAEAFRGHGRALNRAIRNWYLDHDAAGLAYRVVKYQQRDGWLHRDLLRLAKPKGTGVYNDIFHWITKGWDTTGETPHPDKAMQFIWAFELAKVATDKNQICRLIREFGLVREAIPTRGRLKPTCGRHSWKRCR